MPRTPAVTDEQIVKALRKARKPQTAAQLGVPAYRLKAMEGVVQSGTVQTGQRGRPALLFTLA